MNLAILKKSRHSPKPGDVFAMLPSDGLYLFGRVVANDANPLGVGGAILLYIFSPRSRRKTDVPLLRTSDLLLAPIMTNRLPWSRGYFENICNQAITSPDRLEVHCFKDSRGWYFDEYGNRLPSAVGRVGQWGLHSFQTIDDDIARALELCEAAN